MASLGRERDLSVETLRGVAILLVTAYHAAAPLGAVAGPDSVDPYEYAAFSLSFLRLPLFTLLSGIVYAFRPVRPGALGSFIRGKARRLLLPFASFVTVAWGLRVALGIPTVPPAQVWRIYVLPFDQYWFLIALSWVLLAVGIADHRRWLDDVRGWLVALGLTLAANLVVVRLLRITGPLPDPLAWQGTVYLAPFFVLGLGIVRHGALLRRRWVTAAALAVLVVGLAVQQLAAAGQLAVDLSKGGVLGLAVGVSAMILLGTHRPRFGPLAWLGSRAYAIFLLHGFCAEAGAFAAQRLGADSVHALFFARLLTGLACGIAGHHLLRATPITRRLFLGRR